MHTSADVTRRSTFELHHCSIFALLQVLRSFFSNFWPNFAFENFRPFGLKNLNFPPKSTVATVMFTPTSFFLFILSSLLVPSRPRILALLPSFFLWYFSNGSWINRVTWTRCESASPSLARSELAEEPYSHDLTEFRSAFSELLNSVGSGTQCNNPRDVRMTLHMDQKRDRVPWARRLHAVRHDAKYGNLFWNKWYVIIFV